MKKFVREYTIFHDHSRINVIVIMEDKMKIEENKEYDSIFTIIIDVLKLNE